MEVVVNRCWGGFGLSPKALKLYNEKKGTALKYNWDIERDDPVLVEVVKELGEDSWGDCAKLRIVDVPDDISWEIDDYDGMETVEETHRSW